MRIPMGIIVEVVVKQVSITVKNRLRSDYFDYVRCSKTALVITKILI